MDPTAVGRIALRKSCAMQQAKQTACQLLDQDDENGELPVKTLPQ
jgi:hypothetical protein